MKFFVYLTSLTLIHACATVDMATIEDDLQAKDFTSTDNKATIYIVRSGGIGSALLCRTYLDGKYLGSLSRKSYRVVKTTPGSHTLIASGGENEDKISTSMQKGHSYFYAVDVDLGFRVGRCRLKKIPRSEGVELINNAKLAE